MTAGCRGPAQPAAGLLPPAGPRRAGVPQRRSRDRRRRRVGQRRGVGRGDGRPSGPRASWSPRRGEDARVWRETRFPFRYRASGFPAGAVIVRATFAPDAGRCRRHPAADLRLPGPAECQPAGGVPVGRLDLQEPARRLCGPTGGCSGRQGDADRRRHDLREARELHRESGRGARRRCPGAGPVWRGSGSAPRRGSTWSWRSGSSAKTESARRPAGGFRAADPAPGPGRRPSNGRIRPCGNAPRERRARDSRLPHARGGGQAW